MNADNIFIGKFITPKETIQAKLKDIKAFIFDWDGVFTSAQKNINSETTYSELDVFMLNLFKLNYFIQTNTILPTAIITGSQNPTAIHFAKKNNFNAIYYRTINKEIGLQHLSKQLKISKSDFAFIFDDIVDLSIAPLCGLKMMVNHQAKNILINWIETNKAADYITKSESGNSAPREIFEMLLYLTGNFNNIIQHRIAFSDKYKEFIKRYRYIETQIYTLSDDNDNVIDG